MSFKAEFHISPNEWSTNALRFETEGEAEQYGLDLLLRWTMPDDYRVSPDEEPVNYRIVDSKLERIE